MDRFLIRLLRLSARQRAFIVLGTGLILCLFADLVAGFEKAGTGELIALAAALVLAVPVLELNEAARARKRLGLAIAAERDEFRSDMTQAEKDAIDAEVGRLLRHHMENRDASMEWTVKSEILLYLGYALVIAGAGGRLFLA